jgi:hypothetical protein
VAAENRGQNSGLISRAGIFTGLFVKLGGLAGDLHRRSQFGQFRFGHRRLANLTAPTVHIVQVAPGHSRQGNDANVGHLAVLAVHAKRSDPHFAKRRLLPTRRQFHRLHRR